MARDQKRFESNNVVNKCSLNGQIQFEQHRIPSTA